MTDSWKVRKAFTLAHASSAPIAELTAQVEALYASTNDPAEQRKIGAYLAALKQRADAAPNLDDLRPLSADREPADETYGAGTRRPFPFGDPNKFVWKKGDVTITRETIREPPDPKTQPSPVDREPEPPPERTPVDWAEYLDRPRYEVMSPPESRAARPMLYDPQGKYIGHQGNEHLASSKLIVIARRDNDLLVIRNDPTPDTGVRMAWVVEPGQTSLGKGFNLQSILARGYWEEPDGTETLPEQLVNAPREAS